MKAGVTVLMAVRNGGRYVKTAVDSILNQTFGDFRFLIVDDASTDETRQILRSIPDRRIGLVEMECNVGQTAALNLGLGRVETPWLARMDADDFSAPTRLEKQMKALEADPSLRCVGTFAWWFREDPSHREGIIARPVADSAIKRHLLRGTPMIHGTMVVWTDAMRRIGGYNERYRYSQDRDLFNRLLVPSFPAANVPEPLLGFRRHPGQGSFCAQAADESVEIFSGMLSDPRFSPEERKILRGSLACAVLFRGSCHRAAGRPAQWRRDLKQAWSISPAATLKAAAGSLAPAGLKDSLKRLLGRDGAIS